MTSGGEPYSGAADQETKELRDQLVAVAKEHAASEKSLHQAVEQARIAAAEASRDAGVERARADAVEKQLAKLQDLPKALEAVWRRQEATPRARKVAKSGANRKSSTRKKGSA